MRLQPGACPAVQRKGIQMRYSTGAIILHWLIAALVILNVALALYAKGLPRPDRLSVVMTHAAIGLTVLLLTIVRVGWRLTHRPPPIAPWLKPWERHLAHSVHVAVYVLIVSVPLMGWFMASAGGRTVSIFGLFGVAPLPLPAAAAPNLKTMHVTLAYLMIGLVGLHIAGALKHQFISRDGELARMWFGAGQRAWTPKDD